MTNQDTQTDFSKHWQKEVKKMRTRKKEKEGEKHGLQKVQRERENRERQWKIRTEKEKTAKKGEKKEKQTKNRWYRQGIMTTQGGKQTRLNQTKGGSKQLFWETRERKILYLAWHKRKDTETKKKEGRKERLRSRTKEREEKWVNPKEDTQKRR